MEIKQEMVDGIAKQVGGLLNQHREEISEAMLEGDDAVSMGVPIKIKKKGPLLNVQVYLNFVKNRVKDQVEFVIDTEQLTLPIE